MFHVWTCGVDALGPEDSQHKALQKSSCRLKRVFFALRDGGAVVYARSQFGSCVGMVWEWRSFHCMILDSIGALGTFY